MNYAVFYRTRIRINYIYYMNKKYPSPLLPLLCSMCMLLTSISYSQLQYPVTKKVNQTDDYFGTKVSDPYRWLENDTAADTKEWVRTEQSFTESYLSRIPFRAGIAKRLNEITNYTRSSNAFKVGEYIFYEKNDGLQNQNIFYYQKGLGAPEEVFIDPNTIARDGTASVSLDLPSTDKKYFGYHIHRNGSDWSTEYVMDIAAHKLLADSISWMRGDGGYWFKNGFYYVGYPAPAKATELTAVAKNPKVFYHVLGEKQEQDKLVYEDPANPNIGFGVQTTEDEHFLLIYKYPGSNGVEVLCKDLTKPNSPLVTICKGYENISYVVDNTGDKLLLYTNAGAGNFRIVLMDPQNPDPKNWKEIIPERKEKMESVSTAYGKLFVSYLKNASSAIYKYSYEGAMEQQIDLPGFGSATGFGGYRDDPYVFYNFTSYTYPPCIFKYDIKTGVSSIFKKSVSKIDPDNYTTEQVFYPSRDGTRIPMFLVHKKGIQLDGTHPTLLYAYGGFDVSITPRFTVSTYFLLENGGVYAVANLRGGGEFGEDWHKAGIFSKKQNVFDDFIAAAEWLVAQKYTSREKLAIMGGSNGGLLIGAVMTQRPDLCGVAIPQVGVMDMLRYQKFTSGVFWVTEYGSSDSASQFAYLYKYSPLHNIRQGVEYPATLVMTADHDDRVVPMHSFKFAATMQEKQVGNHPVLIRISTNQGHGASGSSLAKNIEAQTDIYSFMFYNMGITPVF
jgi:prolyl oligopeptidase